MSAYKNIIGANGGAQKRFIFSSAGKTIHACGPAVSRRRALCSTRSLDGGCRSAGAASGDPCARPMATVAGLGLFLRFGGRRAAETCFSRAFWQLLDRNCACNNGICSVQREDLVAVPRDPRGLYDGDQEASVDGSHRMRRPRPGGYPWATTGCGRTTCETTSPISAPIALSQPSRTPAPLPSLK